MEGSFVHGDVHDEPGVLHRVAGEVLHTGHGVALDTPGQGGTHLAHVERVLAVGLLGPPPCRVTQDVDAHASVEVGADGTELAADGLAHSLLEARVPGRPPGHGDREAGGLVDDYPRGPSEKANPSSPRRSMRAARKGLLWYPASPR